MFYDIIETHTTLPYETEEKIELPSDEQLRDDLRTAALAISKFCADRLNNEIDYMETKELKDLAKLAIDLQRAFFGSSDITINNVQQNISQTHLQMFKQSLRDEI